MKTKRSWRQRLTADDAVATVRPIPSRMRKNAGPGTIVIPTLREVYALIRKIPRGRLATVEHLADRLATRNRTTIACPVTTGILAWMVANIGGEEEAAGSKRPAPYWRVLKNGGELNPKYPGGVAVLRRRLRAEGHTIVSDGRHHRVAEHQAKMARI